MPTVQTNDIETYYERRGDGLPIVFVHGMFMRAEQWAPQLDALSDEYTTIAYDVRGHGRTGGSDRETYTIGLFADDLAALLDALDVERPVLCGLSMGGCIAQAFAVRHPDRVAGMVLADTFPSGPMSPTARMIFVNLRFVALLDRVVRYPTLNRLQLWVGNRLAPGTVVDAEAVQRLHEEPPVIPHEEFVKIVRAMTAYPGSDLDRSVVTTPTLVTYGENTPAPFRDMHERLETAFPNASVAVSTIPDAGHASNVDNPDAFSRTVRAFLDESVGTAVE